MSSPSSLAVVLALSAALFAVGMAPGSARAEDAIPAPLQGIGIDDRSGATIPRDVALRDQDGRTVTFGDLLRDDGKPVVLVLAYYQCPMLCTVVLNGMTDGLRELAWTAGAEYRVVTVSIDPRDTPEIARRKRASYVDAYGRTVGEHAWDFLVGDEANVKRLADAVGFHYRWDEATQQYAHAAGAFVLTPDGRVSTTLHGARFPGNALRLALVDASHGKLGTAWDRVVLLCFHYDPAAGSYVVATTRLVKALGVVTVLLLGSWLARLWRKEAT